MAEQWQRIQIVNENEAEHYLKTCFENAMNGIQTGQHILLCGQTTLCNSVLRTAISQIEGLTLLCPTVSKLVKAGDMAAKLTHLRDGSLMFINGLDRLSKPANEILAPALEKCILRLNTGRSANMKTLDLALPQFTFIGATAHPNLLMQPLKECFKYQIWIVGPNASSQSGKTVVR